MNYSILVVALALSGCAPGAPQRVNVFSQSGFVNWEEKIFEGATAYSLVPSADGRIVKAVSRGSASIMYQRAHVNLKETPYVNWSWCVESTLGELDETKKTGDDFAARVAVVIAPDVAAVEPRAINYVWANTSREDSMWPNAFTASVRMLAVRSGNHQSGQWLTEKRNVREDLRTAFGDTNEVVIGIAIMSDTDNSQTRADSYFGDIYFTAD